MGKSAVIQMRPIASLQKLIRSAGMMGNGGYDKAFCFKLCATDYKGTEEDIAVNVFVIGFGLLHCLGAKKRKVTLKTYGMQSS